MTQANGRVMVAAIQAAPVVLDREATLDKLERLVAEAAALALALALALAPGHDRRAQLMSLESLR